MNDLHVLSHLKLNLNINYPDFDECYMAGYEAGLDAQTEETNPYKNLSRESECWSNGWWDAFYGKKPLFDLGIKDNIDNIDDIIEDEDNLRSGFNP